MNKPYKSLISRSIKNHLLQRMVVYAFSDGLSKAIPFLVFPIVAYHLSREEFGLVTNFNVFIGILSPFVGLSTYSALSVDYYKQTKSSLPDFYSNLLYLNFGLYVFVCCIVILFRNSISYFTELNEHWLFIALIIVFFGPISVLFTTKLRLDERAKQFGVFQFVSVTLGAGLTYFFVAVLNWSWQGRIYSMLISVLFSGLIALVFTLRITEGIKKPDVKKIYYFFVFGLPLLPHNLSFWLKSGFEKLFITSTLGLAENGVYSFAQTISSIFVLFSTAFFGAFTPYLFKRLNEAEQNHTESYRIKRSLVKKSYLFLVGYSIILILGFVASFIFIKIFFFEKYGQSIKYLPFFLGFNLFNGVYGIFSAYIFFTKKTNFLGILTILTALFQVGLTIFLVRPLGAIGAGIATFSVSMITAVGVIIYSQKVFKMPWLNFNSA